MGTAIQTAGMLAFSCVGLATGLHLIRQIRGGAAPGIHRLAVVCIFVGGASLGLNVAGQIRAFGTGPEGEVACIVGDLGVRVAMAGIGVFAWRVFRPDSAWAPVLAGAMALVLLAGFVAEIRYQPSLVTQDPNLWSGHLTQLGVALPFAWSAVETWLQWQPARKRLRLGLTTPEVVQRYALWVAATTGFVAVCAMASLAAAADGAGSPVLAEAARGVRGLLYLGIVACVWWGLLAPVRAAPEQAESEA